MLNYGHITRSLEITGYADSRGAVRLMRNFAAGA